MVNAGQIRAARGWLNFSQDELAAATGLAKRTIVRIENGTPAQDRTLRDIQQALEKEGVEFLFEGSVGVGIRVRRGAP